MDTLIFKPAGKLSEYLNKDEVTYNIWHSSNIWPDARIKDNGILYPDINSNLYLYQKLTKKDTAGLFEPLEFFNLLYDKLVYILNNIENPEETLFYLKHLKLGERQFLFLWYSLSYIILNLNGYPIDDFLKMKGPKYRKLAWINLEFDHYYKELMEKLEVKSKSPIESKYLKELEDNSDNESDIKLKMAQIALIYYYEKRDINLNNASDIAEKFGFKSANSGHKLYDIYIQYTKKVKRQAIPESERTYNNKIELFESILNHLSDDAKQWAQDELKILKLKKPKEF